MAVSEIEDALGLCVASRGASGRTSGGVLGGHRLQADLVPEAKLYIRPTEGHMGSLDAVEEILDAITDAWPTEVASDA